MGGGYLHISRVPEGDGNGQPAVAAAVREAVPITFGTAEATTASVRLRDGSVREIARGEPLSGLAFFPLLLPGVLHQQVRVFQDLAAHLQVPHGIR